MDEAVTIYSATLKFDRTLSSVQSWRISSTSDGIDVRLRVASGPDVTVEGVRCRFRQGKARGLVFLAPLNGDTFRSEVVQLDDRLPRLEVVLTQAPEEAAAILRAL